MSPEKTDAMMADRSRIYLGLVNRTIGEDIDMHPWFVHVHLALSEAAFGGDFHSLVHFSACVILNMVYRDLQLTKPNSF